MSQLSLNLTIYKTGVPDLALIIAQESAGFVGAVPEQADVILAIEVLAFINNRLKET